MKFEGGCYCGYVRYEASGEPLARVQCHCRQCQHLSGGHPNVIIGMPLDGFKYTRGKPKQFTMPGLENPRTRDFCDTCGTQLLTRSPALPTGVYIKVGTMDDPSLYGKPAIAIQTADAQEFHHIPEDAKTFERWPK
ncbi:MAG: GFA family protein [Rhodospirillaceae bacterium]